MKRNRRKQPFDRSRIRTPRRLCFETCEARIALSTSGGFESLAGQGGFISFANLELISPTASDFVITNDAEKPVVVDWQWNGEDTPLVPSVFDLDLVDNPRYLLQPTDGDTVEFTGDITFGSGIPRNSNQPPVEMALAPEKVSFKFIDNSGHSTQRSIGIANGFHAPFDSLLSKGIFDGDNPEDSRNPLTLSRSKLSLDLEESSATKESERLHFDGADGMSYFTNSHIDALQAVSIPQYRENLGGTLEISAAIGMVNHAQEQATNSFFAKMDGDQVKKAYYEGTPVKSELARSVVFELLEREESARPAPANVNLPDLQSSTTGPTTEELLRQGVAGHFVEVAEDLSKDKYSSQAFSAWPLLLSTVTGSILITHWLEPRPAMIQKPPRRHS